MSVAEPMASFINGQEKIRAEHLKRTAYIYLRQSTPAQVLYHRESQVNQERMADRARQLGWHNSQIQIIRSDLGQSGREAENRQGFQRLLSEVSLGQVGAIFGYEVSRLSRNNSDWYRLLEAAALFDTLIADYDGIYDLNLFNDRLLLGLKGTMSEAELHLLQLRMAAGRKRQLERGVYRQALPTGYVRLEDGTVLQDPDEHVRSSLQLIFAKFREFSSCGQLLAYLRKNRILIPRRQIAGVHKGKIVWKLPTRAALYEILTIPTYAGVFVYGRRQSQRGRSTRLRRPMSQWRYIHHDIYPAYLSWHEYLENQQRLQANRPVQFTPDATGASTPREGNALLQGIVFCGRCGHRMSTVYKPYGRYVCQTLRQRFGEGHCDFLNANLIDPVVVQAFFEALQPAQLDALQAVVAQHDQEYLQLRHDWQNRIQQATYEAHRAQRQYQLVDPENRLVAAELERRWEASLQRLQQVETAYAAFETEHTPLTLSAELCDQFRHICQKLPSLWEALTPAQKKSLLRTLIKCVTLHRPHHDQAEIRIAWVSGHVSCFTIPVFIHQNHDVTGYEGMLDRIRELWQQNVSDEVIAQTLTTEGFVSARLNHVSPYTVQVIRLRQRWLRSPSPKLETPSGYLKVDELAQRLHMQTSWLYRCIRQGVIPADDYVRHVKRGVILFRDEPAILEKIRNLKQT